MRRDPWKNPSTSSHVTLKIVQQSELITKRNNKAVYARKISLSWTSHPYESGLHKTQSACIQLFRERLFHKSVKAYAAMPNGFVGNRCSDRRLIAALVDLTR